MQSHSCNAVFSTRQIEVPLTRTFEACLLVTTERCCAFGGWFKSENSTMSIVGLWMKPWYIGLYI